MTHDAERDSKAWIREALKSHEEPLVRFAFRITGDLEEARDVVQDVFLRLCHQDRSQIEGHLSAWLFSVCRNRALDLKRKGAGMKTISSEQIAFDPERGAFPATSDLVSRREHLSQILYAVDDLPLMQRDALRLKFSEGMSYREISQVIDTSVSHVGVLIHSALKTLRQKMAPEIKENTHTRS